MKTKLFTFLLFIFIITACNNSNKSTSEENNATEANDSIEVQYTAKLTRPDPPYDNYDCVLVAKFVNMKEYTDWKKQFPTWTFTVLSKDKK